MTLLEAKKAICRKLDISYDNIASNDLFADADLEEWINVAAGRTWDYRPWPFSTRTKSVTTVNDEYYDQPEDLMVGSLYRLAVNGEDFGEPTDYESYRRYKEDYPTGTDKIWSMDETYVFVNKLAYTVGETMDMTGKLYPPYLDTTTDLLPFSPKSDNYEHSGNQAIVLLAYAEALGSEKLNKQNESELQEKKAFRILDLLWRPFASQKARQQTTKQMFHVPDFFGPSNSRNNIGNFNQS